MSVTPPSSSLAPLAGFTPAPSRFTGQPPLPSAWPALSHVVVAASKPKMVPSCDSCKTRRVKCVRLGGVGADGTPSCEKCIEKGLSCAVMRVVGRRKMPKQPLPQPATTPAPATPPVAGDSAIVVRRPSPVDVRPLYTFSPGNDADGHKQPTEWLRSSPDVDQLLTQMAISSQLAEHLVTLFAEHLKSGLPDVFRQRLAKSDPMRNVLCAAVICVGARATPNPLIVGGRGPSEIQLRRDVLAGVSGGGAGTESVEQGEWGRRRETACRTLLERALTVCDQKGAMRTPSVESILALQLLAQMLDHVDPTRTRSAPLLATCMSHIRTLTDAADPQLFRHMYHQNDPMMPTIPLDPDDFDGKDLLLGAGMGWAFAGRDALFAATCGRSLVVTDEDIDTFMIRCGRPPTTPEEAADYRLRFLDMATPRDAVECVWWMGEANVRLCRALVKRVVGFVARQRREVDLDFVNRWFQEIDLLSEHLRIALKNTPNPILAPIAHYLYANLSPTDMSNNFLILACDRVITNRLTAALEPGSMADAGYMRSLRLMKAKTEWRAFEASRGIVRVLRYAIDLGGAVEMGMVSGTFVVGEWLPKCAYHLSMMAPKEDGGPPNYDLTQKVQILGDVLDVLRGLAWSWAGYEQTIGDVKKAIVETRERQFGYAQHTNQSTVILNNPTIVTPHFISSQVLPLQPSSFPAPPPLLPMPVIVDVSDAEVEHQDQPLMNTMTYYQRDDEVLQNAAGRPNLGEHQLVEISEESSPLESGPSSSDPSATLTQHGLNSSPDINISPDSTGAGLQQQQNLNWYNHSSGLPGIVQHNQSEPVHYSSQHVTEDVRFDEKVVPSGYPYHVGSDEENGWEHVNVTSSHFNQVEYNGQPPQHPTQHYDEFNHHQSSSKDSSRLYDHSNLTPTGDDQVTNQWRYHVANAMMSIPPHPPQHPHGHDSDMMRSSNEQDLSRHYSITNKTYVTHDQSSHSGSSSGRSGK